MSTYDPHRLLPLLLTREAMTGAEQYLQLEPGDLVSDWLLTLTDDEIHALHAYDQAVEQTRDRLVANHRRGER